jgi:hypothetical protein
LEEITVSACNEVLKKNDDNISLILGNQKGILDSKQVKILSTNQSYMSLVIAVSINF